jgi:dolichyl-diphosphooligosaccharide--protein glycosyltransferase
MAQLGEGDLAKEQLIKGLKAFGKLRIHTSHASIICYSALLLILFIAFTIRILPIRWEIPSGQVRLNEFDPYYQYTVTSHMVQYGLFSPYLENNGKGWINYMQWYPAGLNMGHSLPSLPMTAAVLYSIISWLGVNIELMTFCSTFPAIFGTLSCLLIYFIGKDMSGKTVGLFAALFLALAPSFIQRTALGFFDTEVMGMVGLILFIFLFLRAIEETRSIRSSLFYSVGAGAALAYFIGAWGAAYYVVDLAALFVFVLILLKRYSPRLLFTYSLTFGFGLLIATKIPRISLAYITSGAVLPVLGVFLLLCLAEVLRHNISARTKTWLTAGVLAIIVGGFTAMWQLGFLENIAGKFYSVLDPFLRSAAPIIESVAEHRISAWGNIYFELGLGILFFLAGLYFTLRNPTNRNVFLLIFGATALYFAASMVRLLVIFAPAFSLLVAIGILGILKPFYTLLREASQVVVKTKRRIARVSKEYSGIAIFLIFMIVVTNIAFSPQTGGMPRVYGSAYAPITISASSLPLGGSLPEPAEEWLNMLSYTANNLQPTTIVCAWWDYGYWLTYLGNVTTLADNATINTTQIENIGFIFMAPEDLSMQMLANYNASYILVFTTLGLATSSDGTSYIVQAAGYGDEGKWSWMARISGQARERFIQAGLLTEDTAWTDENDFGTVNNETGTWQWNDMGKNSTVYKLLSWAKQRWVDVSGTANNIQADEQGVEPTYFEEEYFSGENLSPIAASTSYGGIIPVVALYKIDWESYYNATGQP